MPPQEYGKAERLELARKSRQEAPAFGGPHRQQLIQDVHDLLLQREAVRANDLGINTWFSNVWSRVSRLWGPQRQQLIQEVHEFLLQREAVRA